MSYIILDLDNTISNDGWRILRIAWDEDKSGLRYHEYQLLAGFDQIGNEGLFRNTACKIIIITGRPAFYAPITLHWLDLHGVNVDTALFRANGDHRSSVQVKHDLLFSWLKRCEVFPVDIACAYDDNHAVIDMYKRAGIKAQHVKLHEVPYAK